MITFRLSYYRARYYDPSAGRFLSEDPVGFLAGINKYRFVRNSPVNWVDRFGTNESECGCPDTNKGNTMPLGRRVGLAFSGIVNVVAGGSAVGLALGAEAGTVGMATPLAAYVAVQGAGHFVQGVTEVVAATVGDNAGEALVDSATDVTNNLSIYGLGTKILRNRELSATAKGVDGLIITLLFEPENLPLIGAEGAHIIQEGLGIIPKKCP